MNPVRDSLRNMALAINPVRDSSLTGSTTGISSGMNNKFLHKDLAAGRWRKLSLMEQLGNIGSEVGRARIYYDKGDNKRLQKAVDRALELFDLTLADSRWRGRLLEIGRARDVFCDAILGGKEYNSNLSDLERYLTYFAIAARLKL